MISTFFEELFGSFKPMNTNTTRPSGPVTLFAGDIPVTVEIRDIGPKEAESYMLRNTDNRPFRESRARDLMRIINAGLYMFNGEPMIFADDGSMMTGQHTCSAVIETGKTIRKMVVRGVPRSAFPTIDQAAKRNGGDILSNRVESSRSVAAALQVVERYFTSRMCSNGSFSPQEIERLFDKYPGIIKSVRKVGTPKLCSPSTLAGLHYLFSQKDEAKADEFVSALLTGKNVGDGAIYTLREKLLANSLAKKKLPGPTIAAFIVKAWNHYSNGTVCGLLKWLDSEPFPTIR